MKYFILILIIALGLTSCGTIKNNYLKNNCKQDTVLFETIIHDTIEIPGAKADTSFTIPNCDSNTTDSVTVINGKVSATMVRKGNKFKLSANYKGDSLIYSKPIKLYVPCNCPPCPELSNFNKIFLEAKWWLLIVLGILLLVIFKK